MRALRPGLAVALALVLTGCRFDLGTGEAAPAKTPAATKSPPKRVTIRTVKGETSVPIRVVVDGGSTTVMVPVRVNGKGPFEFILDTGAATSTVDQSLVRKLKLPKTGQTSKVRGVTGSATVPLIRLRAWSVGGEVLHNKTMTVVDMGDPNVAGLLGSDELRRFGRVTVDYKRQRLILRAD